MIPTTRIPAFGVNPHGEKIKQFFLMDTNVSLFNNKTSKSISNEKNISILD